MRGRLRNVAPLAVAIGVLLAGCGGDDSPGGGTATTSRPATTPPQTAVPEQTSTAKKKQRNKDTSDQQDSAADATGNGGGATQPDATAPEKPASAKKKKRKSTSTGSDGMSLVRRNLFSQAREVCKVLTLDGLAREYKVKSKKPSDVAETYAASYATTVRSAVEAGCKRGLLESK